MKLSIITSLFPVFAACALAMPISTSGVGEPSSIPSYGEPPLTFSYGAPPSTSNYSEPSSTSTYSEPSSTSSLDEPTSTSGAGGNFTRPYYLRTKALNGPEDSKDGLYVWNYHTGAGTSDAVLGDISLADPAYLNNTYQFFNITEDIPWTFFLASAINYAGWEPVTIEPGYHTSDLFLNETGLQWTESESFGGWLACDWYHGVPQLFWRVAYDDYDLNVSTCSRVELIAETEPGFVVGKSPE